MNPRNRDARRLRAVRRPHSLILTLSIRPSSKSNDDTSSLSVRLSSSFSVPSPERKVDVRPRNPHSPIQKFETSCHTCRPQPPVSLCQLWVKVMCKALPNRLGFAWCKCTSNSFSVCLVSSPGDLGPGGFYNRGAWTREVYLAALSWRGLLFCPKFACVACFT